MKNLLNIMRYDSASQTAAGLMEAPLSLRIFTDGRHQITLSTSKILTEGSESSYGLEALFAYKLIQMCNTDDRTLGKIELIRNGNLGSHLNTTPDILAIQNALPAKGDCAKILHWTFRNDGPTPLKDADQSDFSYFKTDQPANPPKTITPGIITLAAIYEYLQAIHHIEPSEGLAKKLSYITAS